MNCITVREMLPLSIYGDLSTSESLDVERHLEICAECRNELTLLEQVRDELDMSPAPEIAVNPANIFLATSVVAPATRRRWIGWRTIAVGLAASMMVLAFLNLEVRVDDRQLIVRWGQPIEPKALLIDSNSKHVTDSIAALDERVRLLQQLAHALARDVVERDRSKSDELVRTKTQLDALSRLTGERWVEARRDVDALYAAQFKTKFTE